MFSSCEGAARNSQQHTHAPAPTSDHIIVVISAATQIFSSSSEPAQTSSPPAEGRRQTSCSGTLAAAAALPPQPNVANQLQRMGGVLGIAERPVRRREWDTQPAASRPGAARRRTALQCPACTVQPQHISARLTTGARAAAAAAVPAAAATVRRRHAPRTRYGHGHSDSSPRGPQPQHKPPQAAAVVAADVATDTLTPTATATATATATGCVPCGTVRAPARRPVLLRRRRASGPAWPRPAQTPPSPRQRRRSTGSAR